jgi:hypothetical protein
MLPSFASFIARDFTARARAYHHDAESSLSFNITYGCKSSILFHHAKLSPQKLCSFGVVLLVDLVAYIFCDKHTRLAVFKDYHQFLAYVLISQIDERHVGRP